MNWFRNDPDSAIAWARQQTDPHIQEAIWPNIASQLAQTDVQGALTIAQSLTGDARTNAIGNVLSTWAQNDPASAAAYAIQMPDGPDKENSLRYIASSWMQNDPAGASQWIINLPSGPAKDGALQQGAFSALQSDPATAMNLAASIGNDQIRQSLQTNLASNWLRNDRPSAIAWIQNSGLPQETKDNLLKQR